MGFSFKKTFKKVIKKADPIFGPKSWKTGAAIGAGVVGGRALFGAKGPASPPGVVGTPSTGPGFSGYLKSFGPAILGLGSDIYSARMSARGVEDANQMSVQSARERMAFEERMSSTSHQREVEDLRAAGLNPALSANSGASTPAGTSVDFDNEAPDYRGSVASAIAARAAQKQFEEIDSRIAVHRGEGALMAEQANAAVASAQVARETAARIKAERFQTDEENKFIRDNPRYIPIKKLIDVIGGVVGSARDAGILFRSIKGFGPETSETFGPQGEHKRTTIRSRR